MAAAVQQRRRLLEGQTQLNLFLQTLWVVMDPAVKLVAVAVRGVAMDHLLLPLRMGL
jgi:hypothetical protein